MTGRAPSSESMDCTTASASASMVSTMVAPSAASAGVSVMTAPSWARGSAFARERFQARTGRPARAMFRAIAKPMAPPAPSTATTSVVWLLVMPFSFAFGSGAWRTRLPEAIAANRFPF